MIDIFNDWFQSKRPEIDNISTLLATQLSGEPMILIEDLTAVEVWSGRCGEMLAEANAWLDRAKLYYQPEKNESLRESDRKAYVDDKCADIRKVRDILESLGDSIKQRLILGESILRMQSIFRDSAMKEQTRAGMR